MAVKGFFIFLNLTDMARSARLVASGIHSAAARRYAQLFSFGSSTIENDCQSVPNKGIKMNSDFGRQL